MYIIEILAVSDLCEIQRFKVLCVDHSVPDAGDRKVIFAGALRVVDKSVEQARKDRPEDAIDKSFVDGLVDVDALDARFHVLQSVQVPLWSVLDFLRTEIAELETVDRGLHHGLQLASFALWLHFLKHFLLLLLCTDFFSPTLSISLFPSCL